MVKKMRRKNIGAKQVVATKPCWTSMLRVFYNSASGFLYTCVCVWEQDNWSRKPNRWQRGEGHKEVQSKRVSCHFVALTVWVTCSYIGGDYACPPVSGPLHKDPSVHVKNSNTFLLFQAAAICFLSADYFADILFLVRPARFVYFC